MIYIKTPQKPLLTVFGELSSIFWLQSSSSAFQTAKLGLQTVSKMNRENENPRKFRKLTKKSLDNAFCPVGLLFIIYEKGS